VWPPETSSATNGNCGEFRHYPAVIGVQRHLGMQGMGAQAPPGVIQGDAGFVAGGFDA
jgi:hypothetical protein